MNRDNDRQTSIILAVLGILPIVWLGLLIAPSVKGGLPEIRVYMNQTLAENYGVDEQTIYDLVYDGKWTFDELYNRYNGLDTDLNGDGKMHCLDDFYGIVTEYNNLTSTLLLVANGVKLCETDADGRLAFHLDDERTVAVIDKMAKYFQKIENNNDNTLLFDQTFKYDRARFAIHYVESTLRRFRDMESDYVILPMPKYDDAQDTYVSYINPWVLGFVSIPLKYVQRNGRAGVQQPNRAQKERHTLRHQCCPAKITQADALEMNLILKDKADGTEYVIDYPEDEKGKSKRNMTEEEKRAAQKKSEATKARNAKKQAESQED